MAAGDQRTNALPSPEAALEFGEFIPPEFERANGNTLVIASYNIRYAVGRYLISSGLARKLGFNPPRHRPEAVARHITAAANAFSAGQLLPPVDILALQEADKRTARTGGHHVARELAAKLRLAWVHAAAGIPRGVPPVMREWWLDFEEQIGLNDTGDTGVALLSRLPLGDVARIDLPWHECAWRPRLAVAATISTGANKLRILNAHIDPHGAGAGQLEQLEVVVDQADKCGLPAIIMGDFNTLSKQKCLATRRLLEAHGYTTPWPTGTATWRGALLRFHADWIFSRDVKITRWGVARPLNVSDHWPIWAEIEI